MFNNQMVLVVLLLSLMLSDFLFGEQKATDVSNKDFAEVVALLDVYGLDMVSVEFVDLLVHDKFTVPALKLRLKNRMNRKPVDKKDLKLL